MLEQNEKNAQKRHEQLLQQHHVKTGSYAMPRDQAKHIHMVKRWQPPKTLNNQLKSVDLEVEMLLDENDQQYSTKDLMINHRAAFDVSFLV